MNIYTSRAIFFEFDFLILILKIYYAYIIPSGHILLSKTTIIEIFGAYLNRLKPPSELFPQEFCTQE